MNENLDAEIMKNATEFSSWNQQLSGWDVRVTCYRIDDTYYCHVDNVSPGATVARAEAPSKDEAQKKAMDRAKERLASTKVHK